ncbi:DNA (cytosine-5-)-methyltransferase [Hymenobacter lapidiphilus]|uniref:DNA (cytosine-5-)-methyltransferase n=1 Tax=Hymenobacter sp. CCM 8763 TaxID=2303334 RepID=UPI000E342AF3|nr:DNA (cytosine-5-)-methyltransferase [Hymenobacter sp. CCM 8763]RFP66407.1 DNA (cytosine-5-)-methyltransferase [Hymenobacter sp. CCM 8763]
MTVVKELRTKLGLTQKQLAANTSSKLAFIQKMERGLITPTIEEIAPVAEFLGITPGILLDSLKLRALDNIGEGYKTSLQGEAFTIPRVKPITPDRLYMVDLFCGVGGLSYGFEQTGRFEVVAGLDLLSDRAKTFSANHLHAFSVCSDITKITPQTIQDNAPRPFIVAGGPPCQGFSSIRPFRTLTVNDERNNLFEHFALYVDALQPEWFVMENVVGMLTHKNGETLTTILELMQSIGYRVSWKVLNGAYYGLPQSRERLFIIGNRQNVDFVWPEPTHFYVYQGMAGRYSQVLARDLFHGALPPAVSVMEAIGDLPPIIAGGNATQYEREPLTPYQATIRNGAQNLALHEATTHSDKMMEIIRQSGRNISAVQHLVTSGFSTSYSRLDADEPSTTITVNFVHPSSNRCIHPIQHRALTPREGARLQSFPDTFVFNGKKTQIVKQIGNAVPPLLGEVIAEAILANIA